MMRRFSVAAVVLAVVGAFLTAFGHQDTNWEQPAARSRSTEPIKKTFAARRAARLKFVVAARAGQAAAATEAAIKGIAQETFSEEVLASAQHAVVPRAQAGREPPLQSPTTHPASQPRSASAPQPWPATIAETDRSNADDGAAEGNLPEGANIDYLPPSMRGKPVQAAGGNDGAAAKAKRAHGQQAGARVIYRTQPTSTYDRGYNQRRAGYGRRYYDSWDW